MADVAGMEPRGLGVDLLLSFFSAPPREPQPVLALTRMLQRYCTDLDIAYEEIGDEIGIAHAIAAGPGWWGFWWD